MNIEDLFVPNKLLWNHVISRDGALREIALFASHDQEGHFILAQTSDTLNDDGMVKEQNIFLPPGTAELVAKALLRACGKPQQNAGDSDPPD
ncbi:MAG: hypothetical protein PHO07_05025 [Pirellulales bacterium]|nr:hypothetical protein [Pirellulales bacterium]